MTRGFQRVCLETAERFARGEKSEAVARDLRVTSRAVRRWRREWRSSASRGRHQASLVILPATGGRDTECQTEPSSKILIA